MQVPIFTLHLQFIVHQYLNILPFINNIATAGAVNESSHKFAQN